MGFDSGIYKYPKYANTTPKEISGLEAYYSYFTNDWAQTHFKTPEEYANYSEEVIPSQKLIEYYEQFVHNDEYGHTTISDNLCYWCSNGIWLHEKMHELFGKDFDASEGCMRLSKDDVIKMLLASINRVIDFGIESASIDKSFISNYDEDTDEETIVIRDCDGVEAKFEDGSIKRIYTSEEYEGELILFKSCEDIDTIYSAIYTMENLKKVLENTDFEKEEVFYSGGW